MNSTLRAASAALTAAASAFAAACGLLHPAGGGSSTSHAPEPLRFHALPAECFPNLGPALEQVAGPLYRDGEREDGAQNEAPPDAESYSDGRKVVSKRCELALRRNGAGPEGPPRAWAVVVVFVDYYLEVGRSGRVDAKSDFAQLVSSKDGAATGHETGGWDDAARWWSAVGGAASFAALISNFYFEVRVTGSRYSAVPYNAAGDKYPTIGSKDDPDPTTRAQLEDKAKTLATALAAQLDK